MYIFNFVLATLAVVSAGPVTEQPYKDQYCMDPRTMRKHAAYTEWADAYSCTRHRCQPGGRNLAIYTVGCKRVEAPESAIECEEVVEDTNMQFPFCCTRLRCLVVVRGEVWTRVLGQPWETLPAAPWSHMYKMKKPPPANGTLKSPDETNETLPWTPGEGPVYELQTKGHNEEEKVLRSNKKQTTEGPDCNDVAPRAAPVPDIVIALSTGNDQKEPSGLRVAEHKDHKSESRHKRNRKSTTKFPQFIDDEPQENVEIQEQEELGVTDKPMEPMSREDESNSKYYANAYGVTQKVPNIQHHQSSWTEIPQSQWNEHEPMTDTEPLIARSLPQKKMEEKPENLQAMVDAIGTKMKDIETAVQKMSERVYMEKPVTNDADFGSAEKNGLSLRSQPDPVLPPHKHHEPKDHSKEQPEHKMKKPGTDAENYKRFTVRNYATKYLHGSTDGSTEPPLFVEDGGMNGYFSDASNSVVRRATPKEPAATYMAPVDNRRKAPAHITIVSDISEEVEKKRKKHSHKKKRTKGHHKKHHTKDEKRKRFNRINSVELDRNAVSLEDSSAGNTGA